MTQDRMRPNPSGGKPGHARADWRAKPGKPAPGAAPGARAAAWQQRGDRAYQSAVRWYRIKLAGFSLAALGLVALFVWWVFFRPRIASVYALAVIDYGLAVPPNAWAREDVDRLADIGIDRERIAYFRKFDHLLAAADASAFDDLRDAILHPPAAFGKRDTVVVYLSVHGVADERGMPCLLLPASSPHDSSTWVPLVEVLRRLFPTTERAIPPNKLVILDCTRMDSNWRLGLLYNSFADNLEKARLEAEIPGLVLLNSTSPGQVGWTSPEQLQGSVFGFFVHRGLLGAADQEEPGNGDNRVTVRELAAYVTKHVGQWVREYRGDEQQPMLVAPEGFRDFTLGYAKYRGETELPPRVNLLAEKALAWSALDALWQRHARLYAKAPWRDDPLGWQEFQQKLLWLEQAALAGPAYQAAFDQVREEASRLAGRLELPAKHEPVAANLPLAMRAQDAAQLEKERKYFRQAWDKAPGKFDAKLAGTSRRLAVAAEAWQWCQTHPTPNATWDALLEYVDKSRPEAVADPQSPVPPLIELHFLRLLRAYLDPEVGRADGNPVGMALGVRDLAERAASPRDPRVQYAIQAWVDRGDAQRRRGEDALFVGSPAALAVARESFRAAGADGNQGGFYREALQRGQALAEALALRDRALAEIPYLAQWLLGRLAPDRPDRLKQLHQLIADVQELGREVEAALARSESDPQAPLPPAIGRLQSAVRKSLDEGLAGDFRKTCFDLRSAGNHWQTFQEVGIVLGVPLLTGDDRRFLRESKYLEIASHGAAPGGKAEAAVRRVAPYQPGAEGSDFLLRLTDPQKPEHPALVLLDRGHLAGPKSRADAGPEKPPQAPADDTSAAAQRIRLVAAKGHELRQMLAELPAQAGRWMEETGARLRQKEASPVEAREGYSRADRAVRAAAALWDFDPRHAPWPAGQDPTQRLARLDLHYLLAWHARRMLDDFGGPAPGSDAPPVFDLAAAAYIREAERLFPEPSVREPLPALRRLLAQRREAALAPFQFRAEDVDLDPYQPASPLVLSTARANPQLPQGTGALFVELPRPDASAQVVPLAPGPQDKPASRRVAVELGNPAGQTGPTGTGSQALRFNPEPPFWMRFGSLFAPQAQERPMELRLRALYRGHVRLWPFLVRPPAAGVLVATEWGPYPPPTVQVHGQAAQDTSLVFIFDCSGSMSEPTPVFADKKEEVKPRFDVARDSFKVVLRNLANYPNAPYQVAVFVYGHRRGWGEDDKTIVTWDPQNPGQRKPAPNDGLRPGNDVELIWDMRPLTPANVGELERKLDSLRCLGETPLYLAIRQAAALLKEKDPRSGRRIIAITDGINEQSSDQVDLVELLRLLDQPDYRDIEVDILGFSLRDDDLRRMAQSRAAAFEKAHPGQFQQAYEELWRKLYLGRDELRRLSGGRGQARGAYFDVQDRSTLLAHLEEMLRPRQYEILVARTQERAGVFELKGGRNLNQPIDLNMAVGVRHPTTAAASYVIRLTQDPKVQAAVELEGGEGLELRLTEDGRRLEHVPFKGEERARAEVVDPADPNRRVLVRAHLPVRTVRQVPGPGEKPRTLSAVQFFVSIENADPSRFSPRPAEAWVQIQPLRRDPGAEKGVPAGEPYIFYDLRFRAGEPVPVLVCEALGWPDTANQAEIKLWCKFHRTAADPRGELTVERFLRDGSLQLASLPEITFRIKEEADAKRQFHVVKILVEDGRRGPPRAKIEVAPPPRRVAHQYFGATGRADHSFFYPIEEAGRVGAYTVRITPLERLADQAISLEKPFVIQVPEKEVAAVP